MDALPSYCPPAGKHSSYLSHGPHPDFSFTEHDELERLGNSLSTMPPYANDGLPSFEPINSILNSDQISTALSSPDTLGPDAMANMGQSMQLGPMGMFHPGNLSTDSEYPLAVPSNQLEIAKSRANVEQRFGQVTPPSDNTKDAGPSTSITSTKRAANPALAEEDAQRQRQERARNAAHTRHNRKRDARKDSREEASGDEDHEEDGTGDKREKYREKNRLAAAKCRSKKKASVHDLEDRHRIMAAENHFRKREERELRDELTALRTLALEHGPDRCCCGGLHQYNQNKAAEMAWANRSSVSQAQAATSPSQTSVSDAFSPRSEGRASSGDRPQSTSASAGGDDPFGQSSGDSHPASGQVFPKLVKRESQPTSGIALNDHVVSMAGGQEEFPLFADFLQSSPGGGNVASALFS